MQRMTKVYEDEGVIVLRPADPLRPSMRNVYVYDVTEQDGRDRDAALGQAVRELADNIYYGTPEPVPGDEPSEVVSNG